MPLGYLSLRFQGAGLNEGRDFSFFQRKSELWGQRQDRNEEIKAFKDIR